ncbi:MAG: hypothetical protein AAGD34_13390 [Pseudomonadota bacterium]
MSLLHVSISAEQPERVATCLAQLMGGKAMPFPPFPDCWIAFAERDDGTAIEVYPITHTLHAGASQIACAVGEPDASPTFVHAAIASPLAEADIIALVTHHTWPARTCDRGPFQCVEVWLEGRLLLEVLDPQMLRDYRAGMTMANWARMFGLS